MALVKALHDYNRYQSLMDINQSLLYMQLRKRFRYLGFRTLWALMWSVIMMVETYLHSGLKCLLFTVIILETILKLNLKCKYLLTGFSIYYKICSSYLKDQRPLTNFTCKLFMLVLRAFYKWTFEWCNLFASKSDWETCKFSRIWTEPV